MSVIAPPGTYVWGRQEPADKPANLLRQQEPPPSAYNRDALKPAHPRGPKGASLYPGGQRRRTLPPTPFTPSASAAYTPPVPFDPADFNRSQKDAFPRVRRATSSPWDTLLPRTTESASMYVDSGASDDRGASGPARESSAPTRMGLLEIAAMAKELSDAVADPAVKDLLDETRVVALTLHATATKRPLSDAENSVWAELETVLRGIVENQALGANLAAPTQRIRVAGAAPPGPPGPLGPGGPPVPPIPPGPPVPGGPPVPPGPVNIKLPLSQADQQKQDFISNFQKNDYIGGLYRDKRMTVQVLGPLVEQSKLVNKYDTYMSQPGVNQTIYTTKSGWNKRGIFSAVVSKFKNMATLKEKFDYVVLIMDTFKGYGGIPP